MIDDNYEFMIHAIDEKIKLCGMLTTNLEEQEISEHRTDWKLR